jgi:hypothetical protein
VCCKQRELFFLFYFSFLFFFFLGKYRLMLFYRDCLSPARPVVIISAGATSLSLFSIDAKKLETTITTTKKDENIKTSISLLKDEISQEQRRLRREYRRWESSHRMMP